MEPAAESTWYNPLTWGMPGLSSLPVNFSVDYGETSNGDARTAGNPIIGVTYVNNVTAKNKSMGAEVSMPYDKFEGLFKFRQWNSNNFAKTSKAKVQQYGLGGRCHF